MDTVIDWMNQLLKPDEEERKTSIIMTESNAEDEVGMTFEEHENQV